MRERLQTAVDDAFYIDRLLGRGGMGSVYLAREPALDRLVAIKVLPPDRAQSTDLRDRFRREARTAAQLSHPNIVPLLTFGESEGLMYFVMGYVEGEALSARVQREGRVQVAEAVRILAELAQALGYAHGRGVVHRDVKPENILLEAPQGLVRLTDFGVAKGLSASSVLTSEGAVIGTPHYMSPEQASGRTNVDARSDIYSMGALAFTLFTGRPPFDGRTASEILKQHLTQSPPSLREQVPELPATLADAVFKCLEKEPSNRWSTALDFSKALQASGDSWWRALIRRASTAAALPATPVRSTTSSTPPPSSPLEFVKAAEELALRLTPDPVADRLRSAMARLKEEADALDLRLIGLQTVADPVELRRVEKRLAVLGSIQDPGPEIAEAIDALSRLRNALTAAASRLEVVKSDRLSVLGNLRRLHAAARRLASDSRDPRALSDLLAACVVAASEAVTAVRPGEGDATVARTPTPSPPGDPSARD